MDDGRPLFLQIAEKIEASILDGSLAEHRTSAIKRTELSAFYRVNPATAGKGINLLVDRGILVKRRGLGTFVAPGDHNRSGATNALNSLHSTTLIPCSQKHGQSDSIPKRFFR